jgi:hypothetical protein
VKEVSKTELTEVLKSDWRYILYEYSDAFILSVLCGTIGLYERNFLLDDEQERRLASEGTSFLHELSSQIIYSSGSYSDRDIRIRDSD